MPVVTGIGHETDFTIADFVADLRAPTPSAAAAAVTADRSDVGVQLAALGQRFNQQALRRIADERTDLRRHQQRLLRLHPQRQLDLRRQQLDDRQRRLQQVMRSRLERSADRRAAATLRLDALNPRRVLERGYSIVQQADGRVVTTPATLSGGDTLRVQAAGGEYRVTVTG